MIGRLSKVIERSDWLGLLRCPEILGARHGAQPTKASRTKQARRTLWEAAPASEVCAFESVALKQSRRPQGAKVKTTKTGSSRGDNRLAGRILELAPSRTACLITDRLCPIVSGDRNDGVVDQYGSSVRRPIYSYQIETRIAIEISCNEPGRPRTHSEVGSRQCAHDRKWRSLVERECTSSLEEFPKRENGGADPVMGAEKIWWRNNTGEMEAVNDDLERRF